jgi:mannose-6-phosphate isomerase
MPIEHACVRALHKPWGSTDLKPWSAIDQDGETIGELWCQRADTNAPDPARLLKLLFTKEPLSIQVHPDDRSAHEIGLAHGKTEAWYILSAIPGAEIAIGLKRRLATAQLRTSIEDGSISDLVQWQQVRTDDLIFMPAGTIHAIGPGLVIAEIQQRSDATFRLFDHGRQRELHVDAAVAAVNPGPAERQPAPRRLTDARILLIASPHFVLERIDLPPKSFWRLHAKQETWFLILAGHAQVGAMNAFVGEAIFLDADSTSLKVGAEGLKGLLAYVGTKPCPSLLRKVEAETADSTHPRPPPPLHPHATAAATDRSREARP